MRLIFSSKFRCPWWRRLWSRLTGRPLVWTARLTVSCDPDDGGESWTAMRINDGPWVRVEEEGQA